MTPKDPKTIQRCNKYGGITNFHTNHLKIYIPNLEDKITFYKQMKDDFDGTTIKTREVASNPF